MKLNTLCPQALRSWSWGGRWGSCICVNSSAEPQWGKPAWSRSQRARIHSEHRSQTIPVTANTRCRCQNVPTFYALSQHVTGSNIVAKMAGVFAVIKYNLQQTALKVTGDEATMYFIYKKVKAAHTRLPSVGFRSWSRFLAVSLQVTWVTNPAVGCHYTPPGPQLPSHPLRGLLPISLLGDQRCEQFA